MCCLRLIKPTAWPLEGSAFRNTLCSSLSSRGITKTLPTHGSGLSIVCTEEADDPSPTADVQNHFVFQGFFILQDNAMVLSCSRLVCQHLQVKFLDEIYVKEGSLPVINAMLRSDLGQSEPDLTPIKPHTTPCLKIRAKIRRPKKCQQIQIRVDNEGMR